MPFLGHLDPQEEIDEMDLSPIRLWLVLFHVLAVFGFLLVHGASVVVALRLRSERDRGRLRSYLELSNVYSPAMYVILLLVLLSGILSGIAGAWWTSGQLWIWAAVGVLVVLIVLMYAISLRWFNDLRHAVGLPTYQDASRRVAPPPPADDATLDRLLSSSQPIQSAVVGLGGIAIIAWLMVLKPF